jgi:Uri superfamily endonuclease
MDFLMVKKVILKGTYCLIIHVSSNMTVQVGKLGSFDFDEGFYVYVGSALNSLISRLSRHLSDDKKLFWHVDYLLAGSYAELVDIVFAVDEGKWECDIASEVGSFGVEIKGFGCSDCKCSSHLFKFDNLDGSVDVSVNSFKKLLLEPKKLDDLDKI